MKKVYISLLIISIVLLLVSPVIFAEPNTDLNVLLYSEDKEDTATHLKLYASDEITSNRRIIYSIVITASVHSPLGQGNVIDQGLVALVVSETAEVDYENIKVYGAPTPDSNKYVEYQPESESTKEWFNILGSIVSKIPFLGLVMDLAPIYQVRPGDYGEFIDLNQYDIVKVNWEVPRLKYWQKVQIDIPVTLGDDTEIGLYAYWQSKASSSDGTGPTYARDNVSTFTVAKYSNSKKIKNNLGKLDKDKVAVYHGYNIDRENCDFRWFNLPTYKRYGIKNIFDISLLNTKAFNLYKGIIIDASRMNEFYSVDLNDFFKSIKMEFLIEDYVKKGGVLIMAFENHDYHWDGSYVMRHVPHGDILWDNFTFRIEKGCPGIGFGTNYVFHSSCDLTKYIKKGLIDCNPNPSRLGFKRNKSWNVLVSIECDKLARLMEQGYGKGRILLYAGDISGRSQEKERDIKYFADRDLFFEGFLNYINTYSQIE